MGTRGIHGFAYKGRIKISYNQFDMYPGGVGATLVDELKEFTREELIAAFKRIRMVKGKQPPSATNQERYAEIADVDVSQQSTADWYCLLRNCHGTIKPWVGGVSEVRNYNPETYGYDVTEIPDPKPVGHMLDASDFPADSLFCEWGYVVNLDDGTFEVYKGFQEAPHDMGLFAKLPQDKDNAKYYPIKLVATFDLDNLPDDDAMARLEKMVYGDDGDDGDPEAEAVPDITGMSPRTVGKLAMGTEPTYQDKSVGRIERCAPLYDSPEEADTTVKDMLADLRHVCAVKGLDFDALVTMSEGYFTDEVKEDEQSCPGCPASEQ